MDERTRLMFWLGPHWWIFAILIGLAAWGWLFGAFRRWLLRAAVKVRAGGLAREAGKEYCPDCASVLAPAPEDAAGAAACVSCEGKWIAQSALAELAARRKKALEWFSDELTTKDKPLPCPRCAKTMETGGFSLLRFTVSRCQPCAGYWFNRIDWVSCRLEF